MIHLSNILYFLVLTLEVRKFFSNLLLLQIYIDIETEILNNKMNFK